MNQRVQEAGEQAAFDTGIHDLLMGKTTPEECAAFLDERCNAAIDEGWAKSQLHE